MRIAYTRAMIRAALAGALDDVPYEKDPVFNLDVPASCPDVPAEVLNPRNTWASGADYDAQAAKLAKMFAENFKAFERRRQRRGPRGRTECLTTADSAVRGWRRSAFARVLDSAGSAYLRFRSSRPSSASKSTRSC